MAASVTMECRKGVGAGIASDGVACDGLRVRAVRYLGHVWLTLMGEVMGFLPLRSPLPSFSTLSSDGRRRGQSSLPLLHLVGLVRPLLLLLNPPFRSSEPIYSVFRHLSSRRVDFPFSPSVSIDISVPNSFVKEALGAPLTSIWLCKHGLQHPMVFCNNEPGPQA